MQSTSATESSSQEQDQHLRAQVELLRSPLEGESAPTSADETTREASHSHTSQSPQRASNGYDPQAAAQDVQRALDQQHSEADSFIHPDLRAAHAQPTNPSGNSSNMLPMAPPSGHSPVSSNQSLPPNPVLQASPQPQSHNAPLAPAPPHGLPDDPDAIGPDGRSRPKRELSQSKRAAQNRAAQRAFRQRKETYIKQLEAEVKTYRDMEKGYKASQSENYALREYIITLQSRLLDVQGSFPQPPPGVQLADVPTSDSRVHQTQHQQGHEETHINAGTPLEAVARAVAGLAAQQYQGDQEMKDEPGTQDTRSAEEINRHLQASEGDPQRSPDA